MMRENLIVYGARCVWEWSRGKCFVSLESMRKQYAGRAIA